MRTPVAILAVAVAAGLSAVPADAGEEPVYTFVSMPDFLNADVGDTRRRAGHGWNPGDPNSTNLHYERSIDVILDEVEAEAPDSVFVAGDLVEGQWGEQYAAGIFGRVHTLRQSRRAVRRSGNLYYGEWQRRFRERELTTFPAVGDHEIGNNPWPGGSRRWRLFHSFKRIWARLFTTNRGQAYRFDLRPRGTAWENTAYAKYLTPELLLVTVDVFRRSRGGVRTTVDRGQLRWLDRLLEETTADTVVVQGHVPVLGPVRTFRSSGLMMRGGAESAFWQTLKRHEVDLYLCGEVHDVTAINDGVTQISHGGLIAHGGTNYLLGEVYADGRVELTAKSFHSHGWGSAERFWQMGREDLPWRGEYERGAYVTGRMTLGPAGDVVSRSGSLASAE